MEQPLPSAGPSVRRTLPALSNPRVDVGGSARAIVVGRAQDVPRALEHPVIGEVKGLRLGSVFLVDDVEADFSAQAAALDALLRETLASTLFIAGPLGPGIMRVVTDIALLHECRVIAVMPSEVLSVHEPRVVWDGERPLIQLLEHRRRFAAKRVKRAVDVTAAALGLLALSPLLAAIGLLLRLDSRGPILFRHRRVGRGGVLFSCLKFRTMVEDAEAQLTADATLRALYRSNNFRIPDAVDRRVTRLGRILRRCSFDELPQLWNVLVGEMSLIGPRPVVSEELAHFAGSERLLLSVRPGMTGMWAVSGRHGCAYPERAELELSYVRSWSLLMDARILMRTAQAVTRYGTPTHS